jgi:hypothetical protein
MIEIFLSNLMMNEPATPCIPIIVFIIIQF